jgi:hypothetical protein
MTQDVLPRARKQALLELEAQNTEISVLRGYFFPKDLQPVLPVAAIDLVLGLQIGDPVRITYRKRISPMQALSNTL